MYQIASLHCYTTDEKAVGIDNTAVLTNSSSYLGATHKIADSALPMEAVLSTAFSWMICVAIISINNQRRNACETSLKEDNKTVKEAD